MDGIKNQTKPVPPVEAIRHRPAPHPGPNGPPAPVATPPQPGERVTLTEGARALLGRSNSDVRESQVDPARISALRLAIESGTYEINADRIADRLLRMEQDL